MTRQYLILALITIGLAFLIFQAPSVTDPASEITRIKALTDIGAQGTELQKLLERVGPVETQELMFRSGLPFTGQTHLLIHVVGDYIYDQYGVAGLPYCRDYFLSACYHGFIINTLGDHGLAGMTEVMEKCEEAGPGVAAQCAHGSGHGFVAWHDYNLLAALKMCDELGERTTRPSPFPFFNCYDGVFMENFWGVHNGVPSEKRWVKADDIYYPCNDPRIAEKYLTACWANQATLAYQHYQGDFRKTALFCDSVEKSEYRAACYNNFARQTHPVSQGQKDQVFALCSLATGETWKNDCILTNVTAAWSVGDRENPYEICAATQGSLQNGCFGRIISMINYHYGANPREKNTYCDKIAVISHRQACKR